MSEGGNKTKKKKWQLKEMEVMLTFRLMTGERQKEEAQRQTAGRKQMRGREEVMRPVKKKKMKLKKANEKQREKR